MNSNGRGNGQGRGRGQSGGRPQGNPWNRGGAQRAPAPQPPPPAQQAQQAGPPPPGLAADLQMLRIRGNGLASGAETKLPEIRGARRRPRTIAPPEDQSPANSRDDIVATRAAVPGGQTASKIGDRNNKGEMIGLPVKLLANYFKLIKKNDWGLFKYRVDFNPDEEITRFRKALFRRHQGIERLGINIFDGYDLYMVNRITEPLTVCSTREQDGTIVEMTIRLVAEIAPGDATMLHFYNIIIRKSLQGLNLVEFNRSFFDPNAKFVDTNLRIEFWPGYVTSMRQCENSVLLRVEIKHKLVRTDNVLREIQSCTSPNYKAKLQDDIVNTVVLTSYNNKTYTISDIEWDLTPSSTFDMKGRRVTYIEYYKQRYSTIISEKNQPLLVAKPKKRDHHRGDTGLIYLIPELCQTTGLTNEMRADQRRMRDIAEHLHISPNARVDRIQQFMERLRAQAPIQKELSNWGLKFDNNLVQLPGRILPKEQIKFGVSNNKEHIVPTDDNGDWTRHLQVKDCPMVRSIGFQNWVIIVGARDETHTRPLVETMKEVARQLNFRIPNPTGVYPVQNVRGGGEWVRTINKAFQENRGNLDMVFTLLPNNNVDTYSAIKKCCLVDLGVLSQAFLAKNAMNRNKLRSIATKLVIQMNAKLGGVPWTVTSVPPNTMVIGFDVYHCGAGNNRSSIGALVASTDPSFGEYYSTTSIHGSREELSGNMCEDMKKALHAYRAKHNRYPARIFFYRDGVGDGQLGYIYHTELDQIQVALKSLSTESSELPMLTMIVVTKRIESRLFTAPEQTRAVGNPPPGTVVDDVITLPERFDFFLVSQTTRNGTVSPTSYHVLFNQNGFKAFQLQLLTYKLCHLYFNCSANVAVPAPCQYAHKLAYLTGIALQGNLKASDNLANRLYFL